MALKFGRLIALGYVDTLCSIAFLISYWLAGTCCTASSDTDDTTSLIVGLVFFVTLIAGIVGGIILACFCCKCCCWKEQQPHFQPASEVMEREGFYAEASVPLIDHQQWDLEQGDQVTAHAPLRRLGSVQSSIATLVHADTVRVLPVQRCLKCVGIACPCCCVGH